MITIYNNYYCIEISLQLISEYTVLTIQVLVCWCYYVCTGVTMFVLVLLCLYWCYYVCTGVAMFVLVLLCLYWCYYVCTGVTMFVLVLHVLQTSCRPTLSVWKWQPVHLPL